MEEIEVAFCVKCNKVVEMGRFQGEPFCCDCGAKVEE